MNPLSKAIITLKKKFKTKARNNDELKKILFRCSFDSW